MPPKVRRLSAGEEVTLTEHLDELRNRLMVALLALAVAFSVAFWRHGDILDLLNRQLPVQCVTRQASTTGSATAPAGVQTLPSGEGTVSPQPATGTNAPRTRVCQRLQPT